MGSNYTEQLYQHQLPANTKHLNNIYTTMAQILQRWTNIV